MRIALSIIFCAICVLPGCQGNPPPATEPNDGIPDNAITVRQASLFHQRLWEVCEDKGLGLSYGGVLRDGPHDGAEQMYYPYTWCVTDNPPRVGGLDEARRILCEIRLTGVRPTSGIWIPIGIEGRPFYAALGNSHYVDPDKPAAELHGKTPREFLNRIQEMGPNTPREPGDRQHQRPMGN